MKKTILFAAAALAMLASCSQNDDLNSAPVVAEVENNAITFGTYVGGVSSTRATGGYVGSITDAELQDDKNGSKTKGFGVFAYYTGTNTYEQKNGTGNTLAPNFMYNEQVYYNSGWKYDNTKYWPNEIAAGGVDDQDNNATDNPAEGLVAGGKVSFFAYAPYWNKETATDGITGMSANDVTGDPTLTYVFRKDGQIVDLLWGTRGNTSNNVNGVVNAGVKTSATSVVSYPITDRNTQGWQKDILADKATTPDGYTMNADLTKQKTGGVVDFNFKHALAKVGGAKKDKTSGDISNNAGLMIVLDIDENGNESGGTKGANTVVTVEDITIKQEQVKYWNTSTSAWTDAYVTGGTFDLATGKWTPTTTGTSSDVVTQNITSSKDDLGSDAVLATSIAEPTGAATMVDNSGYKVKGTVNSVANVEVEGVTTSKKNVYSQETNPFVFIPGTKPSFTIQITYYVRTFDSNLANTAPDLGKTGETGTWTNVKQTIKKKVTFNDPVELNKMYNIVMHLGLTSVKFTASVSDWDVDGWTDTDHDGDVDDGEAVALTQTYLPINVQ